MVLPGVKGMLTSVSGRGEGEIYLLSDEEFPDKRVKMHIKKGMLVLFDGKRVVKQIEPDCFAAMFSGVEATRDTLVVSGQNPYVRAPVVEIGVLGKDGKWTCTNNWATVRATPRGELWAFTCWSSEGHRCTLGAGRQRWATLPTHHARFGKDGASTPLNPRAWIMLSETDGWMVLPDEIGEPWLWRYDGVAWSQKVPLGKLEVNDLRVDREGGVWLLANNQKVYRYDGEAMKAVSVPATFEVSSMLPVGREVWFFGLDRMYQLEGDTLREGPAPFRVSEAWAAPSGRIWLAGIDEGKPGVLGTIPAPRGAR